MINRLKYFQIRFLFRRDIRIFKKLCGVHHTVELSSAVCIIQWSQARRYASNRGVKLRGVHHTAESSDQQFFKISEMCISLRSQTPRCASLHGVELPRVCNVHDTARVGTRVLFCMKFSRISCEKKLPVLRNFVFRETG